MLHVNYKCLLCESTSLWFANLMGHFMSWNVSPRLYMYSTMHMRRYHARIQEVLIEGIHLWQHFYSWWWEGGSKYHLEWAIIDPPAKRHLNGGSLPCRWWPNDDCWPGSCVIFQGVRTPGPLWIRASVSSRVWSEPSYTSLLCECEQRSIYKKNSELFWVRSSISLCSALHSGKSVTIRDSNHDSGV